jgi:uncharacterized protein (DUF1697 family)
MSELAAIFAKAGCSEVRTYIQSGNVVFAAEPDARDEIPRVVSRQIARRFGFEPLVLVRTADEMGRVASGNPLLKSQSDTKPLYVGFLAGAPDKRCIEALDPRRSPGDSFAVRGREIYLHLPHGPIKTRLTAAYIDSVLETTSSFRNWRTVLKLVELSQAAR